MHLDLLFSLQGETYPTDHCYALYGALSKIAPIFHEAKSGLRFAPIRGTPAGERLLQISPASRLKVRLPSDRIPDALTLAGKKITLGEFHLRVGVPSVQALIPTTALISRMVTFKHAQDAESFLNSAKKFLLEKGIQGQPSLPLQPRGPRKDQPLRRVMRVQGKTIIGYTLIVEGLIAEESIQLQEEGLGGRTKMGCGFFSPAKGG